MSACENNQLKIFQLLLCRGAQIESKMIPLIIRMACCYGNLEMVKGYLDEGYDLLNHQGQPLLILAAQSGHLELVHFLLDQGANIESKGLYYYETCLMSAAESGHLEVVRLLLDHGANIEAKDRYGDNPLILASRKGCLEVAKLLLNYGADIDAANLEGYTPFMVATGVGDHMMLKKNSDLLINSNNSPGLFECDLAMQYLEMIETLKQRITRAILASHLSSHLN